MENNMTPEQAIEAIESRIAEKTEGFAKSEEIASLKADVEAVKSLIETSDNKQRMSTSGSLRPVGLDLDVCVPQWMRDNFAKGRDLGDQRERRLT